MIRHIFFDCVARGCAAAAIHPWGVCRECMSEKLSELEGHHPFGGMTPELYEWCMS